MKATISHYRVTHALGAGGMGEVYAGIDETLKRRVALKAIRAEYRLSPLSKARFLREAQILSQLDHANICRVYDYIEGDDSDWLVLELIEGRTLQMALRGGLERASRMHIAQQIADVLVATHAAGVVHRDLKPGNVMLTRRDEVKVLDFGLAQSGESRTLLSGAPPVTGSSSIPRLPASAGHSHTRAAHFDPLDLAVTRTSPAVVSDPNATISDQTILSRGDLQRLEAESGIIVGTPAYMSPEQARGEPATLASDMYAFGLMLQEMFTGRSAYPGDVDSGALMDRVRRGETLPPTGAPADVAVLVQRLTSPLAAERPTARETANRLSWIRDKPRRRLRNLAIAAVLLAVMLGAAKYTIDLARERTLAVAARDDANRRRGQAEDLIGFMLGDLRRQLEPVGRLDILDDVGVKAMDYFAAVSESALSDQELLRRSTALYQIGEVRIAQGNLEGATAPLEESLALARTLVARNPLDGERLFGLGQSHYWVGFVHWRRQNLEAAREQFQLYLQVAERLTTLDPSRADWQREIAYANSNIGSVLEARGDLNGALERFRVCLAVEEALLARTPDDKELQRSIASSHNAIGAVQRARGNLTEALAEFSAELAIVERLGASEPRNANHRRRISVSQSYIGDMLAVRGETGAARERYDRAIQVSEELVARDGENRTWRRDLARNQFKLGALLAHAQPAEAVVVLHRAVASLAALTARDATDLGWQRDLAEARCALGRALLGHREIAAAAREADAALRAMETLVAKNAEDRQAQRIRSLAHALQARVLEASAQSDRARVAWQRSLEAIAPVGQSSSDYQFLEPLALALAGTGRNEESADVVRRLNTMGYQGLSLPARRVAREGRED